MYVLYTRFCDVYIFSYFLYVLVGVLRNKKPFRTLPPNCILSYFWNCFKLEITALIQKSLICFTCLANSSYFFSKSNMIFSFMGGYDMRSILHIMLQCNILYNFKTFLYKMPRSGIFLVFCTLFRSFFPFGKLFYLPVNVTCLHGFFLKFHALRALFFEPYLYLNGYILFFHAFMHFYFLRSLWWCIRWQLAHRTMHFLISSYALANCPFDIRL